MKHIKELGLFESDNNLFYNHWGKVFTMKEFVSYFVDDIGIFSMDEVDGWMDKYHIDDDSRVCWVSSDTRPNKRMGFSTNAYNRSNDIPETDIADVLVNKENGTVIPEASDDDNSYLFVLNKE